MARCRFFVVPDDGPTLLGMPDIKLQDILKIMCEIVEDQQAGKKFISQTIELVGTLDCRTCTGDDCRSDSIGITRNKPNVSDYIRSIANKEVEKKLAD